MFVAASSLVVIMQRDSRFIFQGQKVSCPPISVTLNFCQESELNFYQLICVTDQFFHCEA